MAGRVPATHALAVVPRPRRPHRPGVGGRDTPGHDGERVPAMTGRAITATARDGAEIQFCPVLTLTPMRLAPATPQGAWGARATPAGFRPSAPLARTRSFRHLDAVWN